MNALKNILLGISKELDVDPDVLWAIVSIESTGAFEIGGGKIPILLERHKVYKFYKEKHGRDRARILYKEHPDICNPNSGGYGRYRDQYKRLAKAIRFAGGEIAHLSTSFGAFQIMGFNYVDCGFDSASEMSDAFHANPEKEQIKGFLTFCKNYRKGELLQAMKEKNFHRVAYLYNGSGYKKNKYAQRMYTAAGEWRRTYEGYEMAA